MYREPDTSVETFSELGERLIRVIGVRHYAIIRPFTCEVCYFLHDTDEWIADAGTIGHNEDMVAVAKIDLRKMDLPGAVL